MALSNYTELQVSVANWLNRQDLSSQIPDFIRLGEAANGRRLRVIQMETKTTGTTDSTGLIAAPADWLETRTLRAANPTAGQSKLEYVGEEEWDELETQGLTGTMRRYTIVNGGFQTLPIQASVSYILWYYAAIPPLSENVTNWLLTKSPDLYLYGSLLGAEAYLKDDDRLPIWKGIRDEILSDMMLESERAKRPTTRLRTAKATYG